jgi:hypothetical protein
MRRRQRRLGRGGDAARSESNLHPQAGRDPAQNDRWFVGHEGMGQ